MAASGARKNSSRPSALQRGARPPPREIGYCPPRLETTARKSRGGPFRPTRTPPTVRRARRSRRARGIAFSETPSAFDRQRLARSRGHGGFPGQHRYKGPDARRGGPMRCDDAGLGLDEQLVLTAAFGAPHEQIECSKPGRIERDHPISPASPRATPRYRSTSGDTRPVAASCGVEGARQGFLTPFGATRPWRHALPMVQRRLSERRRSQIVKRRPVAIQRRDECRILRKDVAESLDRGAAKREALGSRRDGFSRRLPSAGPTGLRPPAEA